MNSAEIATKGVSWVIGSASDLGTVQPGLQILKDMQIPVVTRVLSAHRTPDETVEFVKSLESRNVGVVIAAAGLAAHLPGVVAAHTRLPVIGLPISAGPLNGMDALLSIVQMPPGIPVACVGIDAAANAALLAVRILAVFDSRLAESLDAYRETRRLRVLDHEFNSSDTNSSDTEFSDTNGG